MNPQEYIEKHYKDDLERFDGGIMCGLTMSQFYKEKEIEKWPFLVHFLISQYELNLLNQLIYTYFREDHNIWITNSLPFIDCRCHSCHGGVNHPLSILWVTERRFKEEGISLTISRSLVLEYDKFFWKYVKAKCRENDFIKLTPSGLIEVAKEDADCNNERVKKFLKIEK